METLIFKKKGYKYLLKIFQIYEIIPIELFVDMKKPSKIVKVAHKTTLEILVFMNVYL
jgi:hypothetical protein